MKPVKIRLNDDALLVPQLGHQGSVRALSFSPCGARLAALDDSGAVHIWDVETTEVLHILRTPLGVAWCSIGWRDDGQGVILSSAEHKVGRRVGAPGDWGALEDAADPSRARVERRGTRWVLVSVEGETTALTGVPKKTTPQADPLARYAMAHDGSELVLFDGSGGKEALRRQFDADVERYLPLPDASGVIVQAGDELYFLEPLTHEAGRRVCRVSGTTSLAASPDSLTVAVGDSSGHVSLFEVVSGQRVVRTPRRLPVADQEVATRDEVGWIGLVEESFTGVIGEERLVGPKPLPGKMMCACAGGEYPEVLVALADGRLVMLDPSVGKVSVVTKDTPALESVAMGEYVVLGLSSSSGWLLGDDVRTFDLGLSGPAEHVSVSTDGRYGLISTADELVVCDLREAKVSDRYAIAGARATVAGSKEEAVVVAVDARGVVWNLDLSKGDLVELGPLELSDPASRVVSLTTDGDGMVRGLARGDNDHRHVFLTSPGETGGTIVQSWVVVGSNVVAGYDREGAWVTVEAEMGLRVVRDLFAYHLQDWQRLPEPEFS